MYEVNKEVIEVCGKTFVISEADTMMGVLRDTLISKAYQDWQGTELKEGDLITPSLMYIETFEYPTLIAVTSCDEEIPTLEEYKTMPDAQRRKWLELAQKLNPDYFNISNDEEKKS